MSKPDGKRGGGGGGGGGGKEEEGEEEEGEEDKGSQVDAHYPPSTNIKCKSALTCQEPS